MALKPHNPKRPESAAVLRAVEAGDVDALLLALSPRQRAFAKEYVVDFNASAAAVRAGYSPKNPYEAAHTLLKHRGVAFLIDHYQQSKEAKLMSVTPDYVLRKITSVLEKEGTRDGDILRACELLARHLGMLTDKQEIKATVDIAEKQRVEEESKNFMEAMKQLTERAKKDVDLVE
jgi:phage terminase small subunit